MTTQKLHKLKIMSGWDSGSSGVRTADKDSVIIPLSEVLPVSLRRFESDMY